MGHATAAIRRGMCEVALITCGSTAKSARSHALLGRRSRPPLMQAARYLGVCCLRLWGGYANGRHAAHAMKFGYHEASNWPKWLCRTAPGRDQSCRHTCRQPLSTYPMCWPGQRLPDPLHLLDSCLVTRWCRRAIVMTTAGHARARWADTGRIHGTGVLDEARTHWSHLRATRGSGHRRFTRGRAFPDAMRCPWLAA